MALSTSAVIAFRYVTLDICKSWDKNGKSDTTKIFRNLVNTNPSQTINTQDIKQFFYELCSQVLHGNLKMDYAISVMSEFVPHNTALSSVLADVLVLFDIESQCYLDIREKYTMLLNVCSRKLIPEHIIKERIDFETAGEAGIIKSTKGSQTKFIKIKTRLFYKQHKFNLFREESEGYGKLITELNQAIGGKVNPTYMLEVIKSLIGCFNLDPNRVLDIILESFECNMELANYYVELLKNFLCHSTTICQVLGFKFSFYQNDANFETPASLFKVAAILLHNNLISLDQIYSVLTPEDSKITEQYKHDLQEARINARKLVAISTAADKTEDGKDENKSDEKPWQEENQKVGLFSALLEIGDWQHARTLLQRLPDFYAVAIPSISKKLCRLINYIIDPLYRKYSGLPSGLKHPHLSFAGSNIPVSQVSTYQDLPEHVFPMVQALGPHLHQEPILMVKIVRLAKAYFNQRKQSYLQTDPERASLEFEIITLLNESLLPSLSLLECNCCMAQEMWSLIKLIPYQFRYRLYSQWKNEAHLTHPLLIKAKAETLKKIKYIMKRLSKENVKPSGRQIGKLSHSNPGFLFDYILSQVQTWDNLIGPVVDSLKYLTSLSYDILAFCVIEALSNSEKGRVKHDGTSISPWLQSLASFCGAVFRKYPIELTGLLQFIANQLKAEKSLDLLLLKELVQKMAGIESSDEMTNEHIEAMSGGELLRAEGGYFTQLRNTKKSSQRLKDALLDQDLALPLCLLIAQQRNCILYRDQEYGHLKLVGKLYDQCQDTLVQYGNFLATSLNMDDYASRLPPIDRLLAEHHIQSDVAFFLTRPMLAHSLSSKFEELRKLERMSKSATSSLKYQKYVEAVEAVMTPITNAVCVNNGPRICEDLSPQFFITFWSLSMYDLNVPTASYDREINKLKSSISMLEDNKDMVQSKKKKEKERCNALIDKLNDEQKRQQEHCTWVLNRLKTEKDSWFQSGSAKNETITQFLQLCIFPRCVFTSVDALYCAKFVHLIHTLKTPNFSTLICYDRILCDITYTVTLCTENEANRYGRFLCAMLETVMRWHSNKAIFDKECTHFPGFMTKFKGPSQSQESSNDHVDFENYRHVCHKWHFRVTKALVICLESGDYIQIRNTLIVLIKIIPHFPVISNLAEALERRVEKIRNDEKDKRPDLFALATGYSGQLKAKKSSLVPEHEFHLKESTKATKTTKNESQTKSTSVGTTKESSTTADNKQDVTNAVKEIKSEMKADLPRPPPRVVNPTFTTRPISVSQKENARIMDSSAWKEDHSSEPSKTREERLVSSGGDSRVREENRSEERKQREEHHHGSSHHSSSYHQNSSSYETNDQDGNTTSHRRSAEISDSDKGHKRRRTEGHQTKSPRGELEIPQRSRDDRENERSAQDESDRSSSRERNSDRSRDTTMESPTQEKLKTKDKKVSRKRDLAENGNNESKRRKDEDSANSVQKRTENSEGKQRERHRREETNIKSHERVKERKADREEKKHHRTSSGSGTTKSLKKRL